MFRLIRIIISWIMDIFHSSLLFNILMGQARGRSIKPVRLLYWGSSKTRCWVSGQGIKGLFGAIIRRGGKLDNYLRIHGPMIYEIGSSLIVFFSIFLSLLWSFRAWRRIATATWRWRRFSPFILSSFVFWYFPI